MRHIQTPGGTIKTLRFSPDGRNLYLLSREAIAAAGMVRDLWLLQRAFRLDPHSGELIDFWSLAGSEVAVFTPDFRALYHSVSVAVAGGELDLWRLDLHTGKREAIYEANVPYPNAVSFTPNGHILAIAGDHYAGDGLSYVHRLDVWHRTELEPIQTDVECLAYSPDGGLLATGGYTISPEGIRIWRGKQFVEQFAGPASHLAWSPDGQLAWGFREQLNVARPGTKELVRSWSGSPSHLLALGFSPDGRLLLTGRHSGECALHDAAAGQLRTAFDWGIGQIHSVAFSPDGLTCAAGGEGGQVVVWDVDQ